MATEDRTETGGRRIGRIWLVAAFLAWLVPGAGHFYLGRRVRGIIIFLTVTITFWIGIAIGGVMTVDSRFHPKWFYAQMGTGINGIITWYRQRNVYRELLGDPNLELYEEELHPRADDKPPEAQMERDRGLAKRNLALVPPNENVARAYSGIAGMMNILVVFDAAILCLMGVCGESPVPAAENEDSAPPDGKPDSPKDRNEGSEDT